MPPIMESACPRKGDSSSAAVDAQPTVARLFRGITIGQPARGYCGLLTIELGEESGFRSSARNGSGKRHGVMRWCDVRSSLNPYHPETEMSYGRVEVVLR
jgi:hypothetical protein